MFDPRSDTGLEFLGLLGEGLERPFHHGLDFAAPGRDVPLEVRMSGGDLLALFRADIARVNEGFLFLAMEHRVGLGNVGHVGRRAHHGVH